ncbi:hypothetical protein PUMCH_000016 [Australozyma saopauloensis]|uniref:CCAAT-binding factor domain-containing protein n=1 Tax=Australozyma saopauloensis TaxID=291208 RepID=A0AAX4H322_9ASCO|nr:hypothetical protein PUMCH_000016 [[Candida] saopauloensis]
MAKRGKSEKVQKSKKLKVSEPGTQSKSLAKTNTLESPKAKYLTASDISRLVKDVTEKSAYNSIVTLLEELRKCIEHLRKSEDVAVEENARLIAVSLFKCFEALFSGQAMALELKDEKKQLVARWLHTKYASFIAILAELIQHNLAFELSLQIDALEIYLKIVHMEAKKTGEFPVVTYRNLVKLLLLSEIGSSLSDESTDNFLLVQFAESFSQYWDLQTYFFSNDLAEELDECAEKQALPSMLFPNYFTLIRSGLLYTTNDDELRSLPNWVPIELPDSAYKFNIKTRYQKCLLTVLKNTELSASQYKALLSILHKRIIPFMAVPAGLMDFLTDAYDQQDDDVVPILALNSLWELMKNHNLEYPDFYTKLYSLLTPTLLFTRYRSRFFRLCDLFLSSTHLSANLIASFIKRLARLALTGSAPGVVIVIPLIYNLLKRHPSCMVLLHNPDATSGYVDTFNNSETDPLKTGAMGSSLWEMETLMSHYHPNIATLAKIFGEPFRKPSYNMEDFLDWSYMTLMESEKTRRYRGLASLEFEEYDSLFAVGEGKAFVGGWLL